MEARHLLYRQKICLMIEMYYLGMWKEKDFIDCCVAKLLYLAKRTRPDILLTASHPASRVSVANEDDFHKLNRLQRYLHKYINIKLRFARNADLTLTSYIDASFAIRYQSYCNGYSFRVHRLPNRK